MSFATVFSRAVLGVDAMEVCVETHLSKGLPGFAIVGLPETAVKESKERVRSAILNSGLEFPNKRITVNLAPADLPKAGGRYDLAIALSILQASKQIDKRSLDKLEVLGELALDGSVRRIQGVVPAIIASQASGRWIVLPEDNHAEQKLVAYPRSYCVRTLLEFVSFLQSDVELVPFASSMSEKPEAPFVPSFDIRGQLQAKRAVQIAAAGNHNLLMIGPPGSGKTLLANSLINLLPPMEETEALEVACIHSMANMKISRNEWRQRPLRAPHHSATSAALVGGGRQATPGEISLAHRGILFLDELAEFKPSVLNALREPLESGEITVSRADYRVTFPADFQLLAAMNPCPCGYASDPQRECRCSTDRIERYLGKLSGPLLDRLDLLIEVPRLSQAELLSQKPETTDWQAIKRRIAACRSRQIQRNGKLNSALQGYELTEQCGLTTKLRNLLASTMDKLSMSARATHRVLRVARTIADYDDRETIEKRDLMEAIGYRRGQLINSLLQ